MTLAMNRCTAKPRWVGPMWSLCGAVPNPPRSRPAQKPRPAPVRITTRASGSTATSSRAPWRSVTSSAVSAFSLAGRFMVSWTTPVAGREISITLMARRW